MDRIQNRFEQLAATAEEIEESKRSETIQVRSSVQPLHRMGTPPRMESRKTTPIDTEKFERWYTSVQNLLQQVFGGDSPICGRFEARFQGSTYERFKFWRAVFDAAKDDYENGFANIRALISADVFSDELEQAEELLAANYKVPAAVVTGTVLESTIRSLCGKHGIQNDRKTKLDTMNSELAKVGEYNKAKADQIRAWAKIRNSAAHGHPEEFNEKDIELMIEGVRDFVANQLS